MEKGRKDRIFRRKNKAEVVTGRGRQQEQDAVLVVTCAHFNLDVHLWDKKV